MQGKTIQNFTLLHRLGEGGLAEVWYGENQIGVKAAVKILKKEFSLSNDIIDRFENEARVMVKLSHPHIRKVLGYDTVDARPAILMEYLEGEDLSHKLMRNNSYTQKELLRWWDTIVEALRYMHAQGVVHRDIKPSNLFISSDGDLKLLDFGIAKLRDSITFTKTGMVMGTFLYMSPEQVRDSKKLDYRSDVYSLAVSFFQLVTRQKPYGIEEEDSMFDTQRKIVDIAIDTSILPSPWNSLLAPLLEKDAALRSNPQLSSELKKSNTVVEPTPNPFAGGAVIDPVSPDPAAPRPPVPPIPTPEPPAPPQPKKKTTTWMIATLGALFFVLLTIFVFKNSENPDPINTDLVLEKKGFIREYDMIDEFENGLAIVRYNNMYGIINTEGKELIEPHYKNIERKKDMKIFLLKNENKYSIANYNGKIVSSEYYWMQDFYEGVAAVCREGKYGYINTKGEEIIPLIYETGGPYTSEGNFSEGMVKVKIGNKWGFMDKKGEIIISPEYEKVYPFKEGLAGVCLNGVYGFINKQGEVVIPFKSGYIDVCHNFEDGYASLVTKREPDDYNCLIDKKGNELMKFFEIGEVYNNITYFRQYGKCGFINTNGTILVKPKYSYISHLGYGFWKGNVMVQNGSNYYDVFFDGRKINNQKVYSAELIQKDLCLVGLLSGFYGVFDEQGKEVIPFIYEKLYKGGFGSKVIKAKLNGKWGVINLAGEEIIPFIYQDMNDIYTEKLIGVKFKERWGAVDWNNKTIIPFEYDNIGNFNEGFCPALLNGKLLYINDQNRILLQ